MVDWSAVAAIGAVIVAVITWQLSRRMERFRNLSELLREYRSLEMYRAVDALWHVFRKNFKENEAEFVAHVIRERETTPAGFRSTEELSSSLDGKRRLVSQFYRHLATLYWADELPDDVVLSIYREDVLAIIPRIIVPVENAIAATRGAAKVISDGDDMLKLYRVAKNRRDYAMSFQSGPRSSPRPAP